MYVVGCTATSVFDVESVVGSVVTSVAGGVVVSIVGVGVTIGAGAVAGVVGGTLAASGVECASSLSVAAAPVWSETEDV